MSDDYDFTLLIEKEKEINDVLNEHGMVFYLDEESMFDKYPSVTVEKNGSKILDCADLEEGYVFISEYVNFQTL